MIPWRSFVFVTSRTNLAVVSKGMQSSVKSNFEVNSNFSRIYRIFYTRVSHLFFIHYLFIHLYVFTYLRVRRASPQLFQSNCASRRRSAQEKFASNSRKTMRNSCTPDIGTLSSEQRRARIRGISGPGELSNGRTFRDEERREHAHDNAEY